MVGEDGVDLRAGLPDVGRAGEQRGDVDVGPPGEHLAQRPAGRRRLPGGLRRRIVGAPAPSVGASA